jgi:hypothetical protein
MTFFSYIVLSILKNTLSTDDENYTKLNHIKNPTEYDKLFFSIEKAYPKFINRKIGKHRYEGLIKFQIVLTKAEKDELEKTLYKNQLEFSEYETYESILNRVIRFCNGTLRDKLAASTKDECYKIWFENKFKNFKLDNYHSKSETVDQISIQGEFALAFIITNDFKGLRLLTNVNPKEILKNNGITVIPSDINSKLENGFFPNSVQLDNEINVEKYNFNGSEINIQSLPIDIYIFLQKISNSLYVQTIIPYPNTETYILVKNEVKILNQFKKISSDKNIPIDEITLENTKDIFGETYCLFFSKNVSHPDYKIDKKNYLEIDKNIYKIQKIGGFRPNGTVNVYLDIALPQFKITISDFDQNKLKIGYLRKDLDNKEDKKNPFGHSIDNYIVTIFIKDPDFHINTSINIQVNFIYDGVEVESFDFLIESSKMKPIDTENDFVKLDKWAQESNPAEPYYNVLSFKGIDPVKINNYRHIISPQTDLRAYTDYFVHLLSGAFYKNNKNYIEKSKLKEIYLYAIRFLNTRKGIDLIDGNFSFNNLLKYFIDLGFLQRRIIDSKECYLLIPPTFTKIEKSFTPGGSQIYLLTGLYNSKFTFLLKKIATDKKVMISYRKPKINIEQLPETFLLPDLMLIDFNFPFDEFKKECDENGLNFRVENEINFANTLLNFSASINDFETRFKNSSEEITNDVSFNNLEHSLKPSNENFPRLRVLETKKIYQPSTYFLETEKNIYYKYNQIFSSKWLNLFVKNKRKEPIIIFRKKRSEGNNFIYNPNIYLYKYDQFPSFVTKPLSLLNIGIPSEKKIFIYDSRFNKKSKEFVFNTFLEYDISDDIERRKKLAEILTGSNEIEKNDQIINSTYNDYSKIKITLFTSISFDFKTTNKFILIKNEDKIISFITLGNYHKPQTIYLSTEIRNSENFINIDIDNQSYKMVRILPTEDINSLITAVIQNNTEKIKTYNIIQSINKISPIQISNYTNEEILIIDNY